MEFTDRIRDLLKNKNVTQKQFFEDLQLGKNTFKNWETNNTIPSGVVVVNIAKYFNVSTDYLLGYENIEEKTDKETTLNKVFKTLSDKEQDEVIAYMGFVKERR